MNYIYKKIDLCFMIYYIVDYIILFYINYENYYYKSDVLIKLRKLYIIIIIINYYNEEKNIFHYTLFLCILYK